MAKTYCAYDLSRNKFMTNRNKKRCIEKAKNCNGYYYSEERYIGHCEYEKRKKPRLKRFWRSGHNSKEGYSTYKKRNNNRRFRRIPVEAELSSGAFYKKCFEYWWDID